jgi:LysM repeat protein
MTNLVNEMVTVNGSRLERGRSQKAMHSKRTKALMFAAFLATMIAGNAFTGVVQACSPSGAGSMADADILEYKVKSGDTLGHIVKDINKKYNYDITVSEVEKWNKLTSDRIYVNQELWVNPYNDQTLYKSNREKSLKLQEQEKAAKETTTVTKVASNVYVVKKGDYAYKIAADNHVVLEDLLYVNGLSYQSVLKIGQKLTIPSNKFQSVLKATTSKPVSNQNVQTKTEEAPLPVGHVASATYTVQPGDSLYDLERRFGVPYEKIMKDNNLSGIGITINQKLIIKSEKIETAYAVVLSNVGKDQVGVRISDKNKLFKVAFGSAESFNKLTAKEIKIKVLNGAIVEWSL